MTRAKSERDALVRMRAAVLDLNSAKRFTEANDLLDLIERIDPPSATDGEAVPVAASRQLGPARPEASTFPPSSASPATYTRDPASPRPWKPCSNCGQDIAAHCTTHLLPCCPGSLMHGQDEGTWTPSGVER